MYIIELQYIYFFNGRHLSNKNPIFVSFVNFNRWENGKENNTHVVKNSSIAKKVNNFGSWTIEGNYFYMLSVRIFLDDSKKKIIDFDRKVISEEEKTNIVNNDYIDISVHLKWIIWFDLNKLSQQFVLPFAFDVLIPSILQNRSEWVIQFQFIEKKNICSREYRLKLNQRLFPVNASWR